MSSTKRPGGRRQSHTRAHGRAKRSTSGIRPATAYLAGKGNPPSAKNTPADPPPFCDYSCPHAAFPQADAVGACRREAGVYCSLLKRYNNKNAACLLTKSRV